MKLALSVGAAALALALATGAAAPAAPTKTTPAAKLTPPPTPSPAPSGGRLPYPAYGSPAPDVAALQPAADVPPQITLEQAVAIAAAQSPTFATERAQYDAIRAKYGAAKGALFPSVSAAASVSRAFGGNNSGGSGSGSGGSAGNTIGPNTSISIQGRISQLIFDGGRVLAGLRQAKASDVAGKLTLDRGLQTLQFNVATTYFGVLQANASVNAANQSVRQFQVTEDSIRAHIAAGAAARTDIAQAQFQTARARGLLVVAQGKAIAAQSTFAATLGLDADTEVVPQERPASALPAVAPTYTKSLGQAFLLRPDYLAAQHDVDASRAGVSFAKLARIPSVQATYADGVNKTLPFQTNFSHSSSLGATLTIPIFDQNQTNYAIAQAQSQLDQSTAGLKLSKLGVEQQVRAGLAGVISSRASLTQAQLELDAAKVGLSAAQARYRVGVATILDLVTAEANYSQAQTDYVNALYATQTAEQTYNYAVGLTGIQEAP